MLGCSSTSLYLQFSSAWCIAAEELAAFFVSQSLCTRFEAYGHELLSLVMFRCVCHLSLLSRLLCHLLLLYGPQNCCTCASSLQRHHLQYLIPKYVLRLTSCATCWWGVGVIVEASQSFSMCYEMFILHLFGCKSSGTGARGRKCGAKILLSLKADVPYWR